MPRITPCRILRGLALPWIVMLGLWFCLPSPTISAAKRGTYIQKALASGQQVTTVFEWSSSFSKRRGAANFMGESTTLIIPWQLVSIRTGVGKYDIYLRMTDHSSKDLQESSINLSAAIADATKINGFPSSDEKRWAPYRTNPRIIDMIPAGDPEEEVNMPWFHSADKAIIHYNMHGFYGEVDVDVVVPSTGVAEIWKHAVLQDALDATREKQTNRTAISANSYASQESTPAFAQLYKHITSADRQTGILAVIKLPPKAQMRDVLIERLDGELPSKTLPIRKALMFPLGPVLSIFSGLFMLIPGLIHLLLPIFTLFFIVYTATVLVCWLRAGRPNIGLWASSFWMTRWWATCCGRNKRSKKRDVWGPLGPLKSKGGRNGYDEEKAVGLQRPQTVRLGRTRKGSYT